MSFISLKNKIKSVLEGISGIQEVSDYPNVDFRGYPACTVRTMGNDSRYETTCDNDEMYVFNLYLYQENSGNLKSIEKSREIIEELCDSVRDTFDSNEFLDGVSLPSDRQMLGVRPTVSEIDEVDDGKYVIAEIELSIRISKQV